MHKNHSERERPTFAFAGSKKEKEILHSSRSPGTVGRFVSLQEQESLVSEMQNDLKMLPCASTKVEEQLKYSRVGELSQFLKRNPGSTAPIPAQSGYPVGMGAAFFLGLAFVIFWVF